MERKYQNGISVLICTYNGADRLPQTLHHLSKQHFKLPFEIIVVDNASTDNTAEVVMDTWKKFTSNQKILQLLYEPKSGKINALNIGLKTAKYKYVLICDDDNWLASDYLSKAFNIMEENSLIGILGGKGEAVFEHDTFLDWFEDVKNKYAIGHQGKGGKLQNGGCVYGAGSIIRKEAYDKLLDCGYEPILIGRKENKLLSGEDVEVCLALQILGYEIHYDNSLVFKHFMSLERLTPDYFERLSEGMIYPSFILYVYVFVIKNIKYSWANYWLVSFYLFIKHTLLYAKKFILNGLNNQGTQKRLSDYHHYQVFWCFFKYHRDFQKHWKNVIRLKIK
jgi:glycosyltransferase involved in cell wall biosynthesis